MAVLTTDPQIRDILENCRIIIKEVVRHGGHWLARVQPHIPAASSRRQFTAMEYVASRVAGGYFSGVSWFQLGNYIYLLLMPEPNHNANQCTLTVMQQRVRSPFETPRNFDSHYRRSETVLRICASWNRGTCALPHSCTYMHICTVCQRRHTCKGIECLEATKDLSSPTVARVGKEFRSFCGFSALSTQSVPVSWSCVWFVW